MARKVLLLTLGAAPLPVITPIDPMPITGAVDGWGAPPLAAPTDLTVAPMLDAGHLAWSYAGPEGARFVVQLADDTAGVAGGYATVGVTGDHQYLLAMPGGDCWVRVYASLNGRASAPCPAVRVQPIPGLLLTGTASAVATLQDGVNTINGTLIAYGSDLVDLAARAEIIENDLGGLRTDTTALAEGASLLDARVTANADGIAAQSTQLTKLSASQSITRAIAGRAPKVFQQSARPAISGILYNKLLHTTALNNTSVWTITGTLAASTVVDPEGFLQAWRLTPTADGQSIRQVTASLGRIGVNQPAPPANPVPGRTFTFSAWLRADTPHVATLRLVAPTAGTTETVHVAVTNLFQRFSVTRTYLGETDTTLRGEVYPKELGAAGKPNLPIDIALPQLEEGPAATEYQRVTVATDYDGNGIPPMSQWISTTQDNLAHTWNGASWDVSADGRVEANAAATSALKVRVETAEGGLVAQAGRTTTLEARVDGKAAISVVEAIDAKVTLNSAGLLDYYVAYTMTFDVNGYVSGWRSVNNGTSSSFTINADVFQVLKPGGGDSLTWKAGVLSSRKGSKELKIGPGYGADPAGKRLIMSYGDAVADASATRAAADVWLAENGENKLGGFQLNYGSAWKSGAAVTYSAAAGSPATATISVTAGVFAIGSREYSYSGSSAAVSGTNGTTTTYYLYYEDPGLAAGTRTLNASTDPKVSFNNDSRVFVGLVNVAFPASGGGSGGGTTPGGTAPGSGGGGFCPEVTMWVLTPQGPKHAGDVCVGDELRLCEPGTQEEAWGVVTYSERRYAAGVRLHGDGGTVLDCSAGAPIPVQGGYLPAERIAGMTTLARHANCIAHERIATVEPLGTIDVQHIHVGDRCFWTGAAIDALLLHHNLKPPSEAP
ncbi:hypothetical protein [Thermomonas sp.]